MGVDSDMYKVVYEAKSFYGVNTAFAVFCAVVILMIILLLVFWKKVDVGVRCLISSVIAFMIFIISCQIYTAIDARNSIYDEYKNGKYLLVEGTISNYTLAEEGEPNLPDRFDVNGVEFQVPGFVSYWGYPLKRVNGGILENGINVRICYVSYKFENVIMKLEIFE